MKIQYFSIFLFLLPISLSAQKDFGDINPAFAKMGSRLKSAAISNSMGYIPFPNRLVFEPVMRIKSVQVLPTTYDLRTSSFVTSVKNQGSGQYGGNCWAFAQMGSIESRWLKLGLGSFDLSEQNMVTCHGLVPGYGEGGNDMIAFAYLGRLAGPLSEASDPYNTTLHSCVPNLSPVAYVPEVVFLDGSSRDELKTYLMEFGALSISMYWNDASYYNGSHRSYPYTYYNAKDSSVNHQVLLVGWDDTKRTAGGTGAWIVKNSWGLSWGQNGYFYLAYQDAVALSSVSFHPSRIPVTNIRKVFMNDKLGPLSNTGYKNTVAYALVKYKSATPVTIQKIGTFASSANSVISASIYKTFNGQLADSVTSIPATIFTKPGFYTLDTKFSTDSVFYIKVKYVAPYYTSPIPIEKRILSGSDLYANPEVLPVGTQWISSDGIHWDPCGSNAPVFKADLCIRAYSGPSDKPLAGFRANKNSVCVDAPVTFTDYSANEISGYAWDFGDGANPRNTYTAGPHKIAYTTSGFKTISLKVSGPAGKDSVVRTGFIKVNSTLNIITSVDSIGLELGKSLTIEAFGAESFSWLPKYNISADTGYMVTVTPSKDTVYTVTGKDGTCTSTAKVKFTVAPRPTNDNVCNAKALQVGYNGIFTNVMATVQNNEPAPKEGDCNTAMQWCIEGGLQNSVWFTLTPDKTAAYSIITGGMDTQIAVYEADSCTGILAGTGKLIAANDDYWDVEPYPAAINLLSLTAGKKYWIQIDGSGGGVSGKFTISVVTGGVGVGDSKILSDVKLYPNPTTGIFTLEFPKDKNDSTTISVIDVAGRVMYRRLYTDAGRMAEIDPGTLAPGLYFVDVQIGKSHKTIKMVVR